MSSDRRGGRHAPRAVSGHFARKRFGQHFLADRSVLAAIAAAIDPREGDAILEIGPGLGALTAELLARVPVMVAVEIDRDLCRRLRSRYDEGRLVLFEADALRFDISQAFDALGLQRSQHLRIVGNLPYNISTPLLITLLGARSIIKDQHFLLQKEVVERIVAGPASSAYGRLSVLMQAFYATDSLFDVGAESFDPPPKVGSAVLRLTALAEPLIDDPAPLQAVLAAAFAQRRKMIRSTLIPWLEEKGVDTSLLPGEWRAEQIGVAQYCELARSLKTISDAR